MHVSNMHVCFPEHGPVLNIFSGGKKKKNIC
jgi:hypothetical protein